MSADKIIVDGCEIKHHESGVYQGDRGPLRIYVNGWEDCWSGMVLLITEGNRAARIAIVEDGTSPEHVASQLTTLVQSVREALAPAAPSSAGESEGEVERVARELFNEFYSGDGESHLDADEWAHPGNASIAHAWGKLARYAISLRPPTAPCEPSVEPSLEEVERVFVEVSGLTIGHRGEVQDGWGYAREGLEAIRVLYRSRSAPPVSMEFVKAAKNMREFLWMLKVPDAIKCEKDELIADLDRARALFVKEPGVSMETKGGAE